MTDPVSRADAEALIGVYNRHTTACSSVPRDGRGQPIGRRVTATSVREATCFLRFCAEHAIDPERWIVARHEAIGWRARIALAELHKVGDNYLDHFRTWGDAAAGDATRVVHVEDYDALSPYGEALKRLYAVDPDLCRVQVDTRGWHPLSQWCQRCPQADPCRRRLPMARREIRDRYAGQ